MTSSQSPVFTFLPTCQVILTSPNSGTKQKVLLSLQHHRLFNSYISETLTTKLKLPTQEKEGQKVAEVTLEGGITLQCIVASFEPPKQLVPSKLIMELRNFGYAGEDWKNRALRKTLVTLAEVDLKVPTFLNLKEDEDIEPVEKQMDIIIGQRHYIDYLLLSLQPDQQVTVFRRPTADLLFTYYRQLNEGGSSSPSSRWILSGCIRAVADLRALIEFDDEEDFEVVKSSKEEIPLRPLPSLPPEPFPVYEPTLRAFISLASIKDKNQSFWLPIRILYSPHSVRSYLTLATFDRLVKNTSKAEKSRTSQTSVTIQIQEEGGKSNVNESPPSVQLTLPVVDTFASVTRVPEAIAQEILANYDVELSDNLNTDEEDGGDNTVDLLIGQDFASKVLLPAAPVEFPVFISSSFHHLLQSGLLLKTKLGWVLSAFGAVPVEEE